MRVFIPAKQWKSGPKRKSVSQRIAERRKPKTKIVRGKKIDDESRSRDQRSQADGMAQVGGRLGNASNHSSGADISGSAGRPAADFEVNFKRVRVEAKEDKR